MPIGMRRIRTGLGDGKMKKGMKALTKIGTDSETKTATMGAKMGMRAAGAVTGRAVTEARG